MIFCLKFCRGFVLPLEPSLIEKSIQISIINYK